MIDFKIDIITKLESEIPLLKDKIQPGAVDENTIVPYMAYSTPEESPVRTIHGIAGYNTTFELIICHNLFSEVDSLKQKIISVLDNHNFGDNRCAYKTGAYTFYNDYNIHSYTLTFKII